MTLKPPILRKNQAMPVTKPVKPVKTPKPQGKPKPKTKVVVTSDIRLFLDMKKRERREKLNQQHFEETLKLSDQKPSPSTSSVSATLTQTNDSPPQSAPRADRPVRTRKLSSILQGDQTGSTSNMGL